MPLPAGQVWTRSLGSKSPRPHGLPRGLGAVLAKVQRERWGLSPVSFSECLPQPGLPQFRNPAGSMQDSSLMGARLVFAACAPWKSGLRGQWWVLVEWQRTLQSLRQERDQCKSFTEAACCTSGTQEEHRVLTFNGTGIL